MLSISLIYSAVQIELFTARVLCQVSYWVLKYVANMGSSC